MSLRRCKSKPSHSLSIVLLNTSTTNKHEAQVALSALLPLCRCKPVPSHSLRIVLRNTSTSLKHDARVELSVCMPLCRCKFEPSHSLGIVLSNIPSCIVAHSHHKLPEAAARRSALPRKRKPSPDIFSNTSAFNEAAAESALAVRAAHRRPATVKLKRSLLIFWYVCSAVKQQAQGKCVRGRVLQQRGLPPALGRLPVPLLPVQVLPLMKQSFRSILRNKKMAPRNNAARVMQRVHCNVVALKAHQPAHTAPRQSKARRCLSPTPEPYTFHVRCDDSAASPPSAAGRLEMPSSMRGAPQLQL
jgi:hypothetical protein